jgi:geranylgeranyl reductase family protein
MEETDVTIVGAGPAGLTAALFLAKKNIPVTLIEKDTFPRDKICGDCLGGFVISILRQIDDDLFDRFIRFDKKLVGSGVCLFGPEHQKVTVEATTSVDQKIREVVLCKRIDFDNFLMDEVKKYKQIRILQNTKITNISKHPGGLILYSKDKPLVDSKFTIIATGSIQSLVYHLNGKRLSRKHTVAGIRTYYEGIHDLNDGYIELHFLKDLAPGYLWIFPLGEKQANVGLGLRSDVIAKKNINLNQLLMAYINNDPYFQKRFRNAKQIDSIQGFPLALGGKKRKISGDHYILAGDAANLIEPLFGEGIGQAMYSGKFAADHAIQCLEKGDFSASFNKDYDQMVYNKLGATLRFSAMMQKVARYPGLMSFLFNRVNKNVDLQQLLFSIINGHTPKTRWKGLGLVIKMIFNLK